MSSKSAATSESLLDELQTTLAHGTVARRVETLRRVTDLFINGAVDYSNDQIDLFDERSDEFPVGRLHEFEFWHRHSRGGCRCLNALCPFLSHLLRFIVGRIAFEIAQVDTNHIGGQMSGQPEGFV